jgi:hypothetical protein
MRDVREREIHSRGTLEYISLFAGNTGLLIFCPSGKTIPSCEGSERCEAKDDEVDCFSCLLVLTVGVVFSVSETNPVTVGESISLDIPR